MSYFDWHPYVPAAEKRRQARFNIGTMVADEDDDRAFFARNVIQCVSLSVGGRKPELSRRRIKNGLGSCCRHIAPPCAHIYADDGPPEQCAALTI